MSTALPSVTDYATDPARTIEGAIMLLTAHLSECHDATRLLLSLQGDYWGGRHDRETIELIELRLREVQLLTRRLE